MASDYLYAELAKALSRPSKAYRAAKAAIDIPALALEGYAQGAHLEDFLHKKKIGRRSLEETLGGVPAGYEDFANAPMETIKPMAPLAVFGPKSQSSPRQPTSLDGYLTQLVLMGKVSPEDAFKMKNKGMLLRGGYEEEPDGTLRVVPGGKPAREIEEADAKKRATREETLNTSKLMQEEISLAKDRSKFRTTGIPGTVLKFIPGTDSRSLRENLKTIAANISFDKIQNMRQNSPTGGALGAVSDKDLALLSASRGSLDQGLKDAELTRVLDRMNDAYSRVILAIENQTGDPEADDAIAQVIQAPISEEEKKARIKGIRAAAGL